ncbi:MAG: outer membrane lipoprotein-sorting protein [Candidatus Riflebacteria bacterium]|nr:outer membrane lipoprotein-sorting protein [Candidatus Riflebacteria bacterium]
MRKNKIIFSVLVMILAGAVAAMAMTAQEVLQKVEDRYIGKTSKAQVQMDLVDKNGGVRERKMLISRRKIDSSNKDNFIHFVAPPDIRNTTYLVNEKNKEKQKWIYLSAFKNTRRILAEDYGMAFVSSDFTYEDMDDIRADDYVASDLKEEKFGDKDVYSITVTKKDANTNYAKVVMKVCKATFVVLRSEMYDKKAPEKLVKEMTASNLEQIQEIWTPKEVVMKDLNKGTSTSLKTGKIAYDLELGDEEFSQRNMEK